MKSTKGTVVMLKHVLYSFVMVAVGIFCSAGNAHDLPGFGTLPDLGSEWKLEQTTNDPVLTSNPFCWVVFRNVKNDDLLSFATYPAKDDTTSLNRFSDTALEIFPDGLAVWNRNVTGIRTETIGVSTRERRISAGRRLPVLEYTFISSATSQPDLMANGRAWRESGHIVFVQHTSARPIRPSVVDDVVKACSKLAASEQSPVPGAGGLQ